MATTYLQAVNRLLRRVKVISGDGGEFASFTDTARQPDIDLAKELINEGIQDIYSFLPQAFDRQTDEDTITLATGVREYLLPENLERIRWPLIDETNGWYIEKYPSPEGVTPYEQMRVDQLKPADWTGLPNYAAVNPSTGDLRMDKEPTATENGNVYTILYDKRLSLSNATDTFPFSETAVDCLIAAIAEVWEAVRKNDGNVLLLKPSIARAMRFLRQDPPRHKW